MGISGVSTAAGSLDQIYLNIEEMKGYIIGDAGMMVPVEQQQVNQALEKIDVEIKDGKLCSISDGYELAVADLNPSACVGGTPPLPPLHTGSDVFSPDVMDACAKLMSCQDLPADGLMFQQLMALLKSAQEDDKFASMLADTAGTLKLLALKANVQTKIAKKAIDAAAADQQFMVTMITAAVTCACSMTSAFVKGDNTAYITTVIGELNKMVPSLFNMLSHQEGGLKRQSGEMDVAGAMAEKEAEVADMMREAAKDAADGAKQEFKDALKLLKAVAQRQGENIKAMNV